MLGGGSGVPVRRERMLRRGIPRDSRADCPNTDPLRASRVSYWGSPPKPRKSIAIWVDSAARLRAGRSRPCGRVASPYPQAVASFAACPQSWADPPPDSAQNGQKTVGSTQVATAYRFKANQGQKQRVRNDPQFRAISPHSGLIWPENRGIHREIRGRVRRYRRGEWVGTHPLQRGQQRRSSCRP